MNNIILKLNDILSKNESFYLFIPLFCAIISSLNYSILTLIYSVMFILMPCLEIIFSPIRKYPFLDFRKRWLTNYGINLVAIPFTTLTIMINTHLIQNYKFGVLTYFNEIPLALEAFLAIIVVDFTTYLFHFFEHKIPFLWRVHQVHHTDLMYDASLAYRVHLIEVIIGACIFSFLIPALIFSFSFNAIAIAILTRQFLVTLIHTNICISDNWDKIIRLIFVTPKMHFIHHSDIMKETNSNYGVIFSFWDRLFSTYSAEPSLGYDKMNVGLDYEKDPKNLTLLKLLILPFSKNQKYARPEVESKAFPTQELTNQNLI